MSIGAAARATSGRAPPARNARSWSASPRATAAARWSGSAGLTPAPHIERRGVLGGPLLRGDRHPHLGVTPQWVGWRWTSVAYRAGVKRGAWDGVASHASRRTAATDTYRRTRDPMLVKDLMRWATLQTATAYIHATDIERLRRGAEGRHYAPAPRRPGVESA